MWEMIVLFHKDDLETPIPTQRDTFYANRRTTYESFFVSVIDMFIFNKYWETLVQKRAKTKKTSPGLYHTSVGGHVNEGDTPQLTLIKECLEEVGAPCTLIEDEQLFLHAYRQIGEYTSSFVLAYPQAMIKHTSYLEADRAWREVRIQDMMYFCLGLYNGPIHNTDRSADGFEWFTLDALKKALYDVPWVFTPSYHVLFERFEEDMRIFVEKYCRG